MTRTSHSSIIILDGWKKKYITISIPIMTSRHGPLPCDRAGRVSEQTATPAMHSMKHFFTDRMRSETIPKTGWDTILIPFTKAVINPI